MCIALNRNVRKSNGKIEICIYIEYGLGERERENYCCTVYHFAKDQHDEKLLSTLHSKCHPEQIYCWNFWIWIRAFSHQIFMLAVLTRQRINLHSISRFISFDSLWSTRLFRNSRIFTFCNVPCVDFLPYSSCSLRDYRLLRRNPLLEFNGIQISLTHTMSIFIENVDKMRIECCDA